MTNGRVSRRDFVQAAALGAAALGVATMAPRIALAAPPAMTALKKRVLAEAEVDSIGDPGLRAIAADAIAHAKYSFAAFASGKHVGAGNPYAGVFAPFVAARKPRARGAYAKLANELLGAPQDVREQHFGRFAHIAPAQIVGMDRAAIVKAAKPTAKLAISMDALRRLTLPGSQMMDQPDPAADAEAEKAKKAHAEDVAAGQKYKHLECFISEVKCIEGTGGALEGTEEIALGGVLVGATGNTAKVKQFLVKEGFDTDSDHNTKKYKHGKRFGMFHLMHEEGEQSYSATLAMAELDQGGFGDFIIALWNKVKDWVVAAIAEAAGSAIAAAIGSVIPGLGTLIGAIVGAIIGWLVGLFHNDDDIVGHKTVHLNLHHPTKSYFDKKHLTTKAGLPFVANFQDEGHYRVKGGWRILEA
jgi:hypothetical protein